VAVPEEVKRVVHEPEAQVGVLQSLGAPQSRSSLQVGPVGVSDGVSLGVSDGVSLGVSDGVSLGVSDGVSLGVSDGVSVGVSVVVSAVSAVSTTSFSGVWQAVIIATVIKIQPMEIPSLLGP
jgi:hypothetical protein